MMFRKLYWVSESVDGGGRSMVLGVYTSIPDLMRHGLRAQEGESLRLNLTKLDSASAPLGSWTGEALSRLDTELAPYVQTEEFSSEHVKALSDALTSLPIAV